MGETKILCTDEDKKTTDITAEKNIMENGSVEVDKKTENNSSSSVKSFLKSTSNSNNGKSEIFLSKLVSSENQNKKLSDMEKEVIEIDDDSENSPSGVMEETEECVNNTETET